MIRQRNSFLISIFIHLLLLFSIFYIWNSFLDTKSVETPKKVCLKLSQLEQKETQEPKKTVKKDVEAKKIIEPKSEPLKVPHRVKEKSIEKKEVVEPKKTVKKNVEKKIIEPKKELIVKEPFKELEQTAEKIDIKPIYKEPKPDTKKIQKLPQTTPQVQKKDFKQEQKELTQEYIELNIQKITELLRENLNYPRSARKRNITGCVSVKFTLKVDSKAYNIKIIDSNSDILSRGAIKTIENLSGKFPKPKTDINLIVPITYTLN